MQQNPILLEPMNQGPQQKYMGLMGMFRKNNKGHGPNAPKNEQKDHVHDHKPNTNSKDPKPTDRQPGREPKPNELEKDRVRQQNRNNNQT